MAVLKAKSKILLPLKKEAKLIIKTIQDTDGVTLTKAEKDYVRVIVHGLISIGVWTKIKALYGFVGGTAATHRWNWKTMIDSDAGFRINWNGTITHNSLGVQSNFSGWGDSNVSANTSLTLHNSHLSCYINDGSNTGDDVEIGCTDNLGPQFNLLTGYFGSCYSDQYGFSDSDRMGFVNEGVKGFYVGSRSSNVLHKVYKNGMIKNVGTNSAVENSMPFRNVGILSYNSPTPLWSKKRMAFASIGDGLTDLDVSQMNHIVTVAQGILNRK